MQAIFTFIVEKLNDIGYWLYGIYLDCWYAGWPLAQIADWFYYLSDAAYSLAWKFSDFFSWLLTEAQEWDKILSWPTIWSLIQSYLPNLEEIGDWFYDWTSNVRGEILNWWSWTTHVVEGWVTSALIEAKLYTDMLANSFWDLREAWDSFAGKIPTLDSLLAWWSNWTGELLAIVNNWWTSTLTEVEGLIDSSFILREDFWSGWQDSRDKVTEFFTDPFNWIKAYIIEPIVDDFNRGFDRGMKGE